MWFSSASVDFFWTMKFSRILKAWRLTWHNAELCKFEIKLYLILSQKSVFQKHKACQTHITHIYICECHLILLPRCFFVHQCGGPVENAVAKSLGQVPAAFGLLWYPCPFWRGQVAKEIAEVRTESRSEDNGHGINSSGNEQSSPRDADIRYKAKNLTRTIQAGIEFYGPEFPIYPMMKQLNSGRRNGLESVWGYFCAYLEVKGQISVKGAGFWALRQEDWW